MMSDSFFDKLAQTTKSYKVLSWFANHTNIRARFLASQSKNIGLELIDVLSNDENNYVRQQLTQNPNISFDILKKLSLDENYYVRLWAKDKIKEKEKHNEEIKK